MQGEASLFRLKLTPFLIIRNIFFQIGCHETFNDIIDVAVFVAKVLVHENTGVNINNNSKSRPGEN